MNFAAAAQKDDTAAPLRVVQVDAQVVMKIMKHCKEFMPSLVTGQLLGLDIGTTLEVTNCFPFPSRGFEDQEDEERESDGADYQLQMMMHLREVNVDNNTVGWYQSTYMGSYQTVELIEKMINFHENIKKWVCLVYDPTRSAHGSVALKALKLQDRFIAAYKDDGLTMEKLQKTGISWEDIFLEIPVYIANSVLSRALVGELVSAAPVGQGDYDRLGLGISSFLEKNIEFLVECVDDVQLEQQKWVHYQRSLTRQQQQQAAWLAKRRQENQARRAAGEEPLPEEADPANVAFKPLPEPSRLDSLLVVNQMGNYTKQINRFGAQALEKLYAMNALAAQPAPLE